MIVLTNPIYHNGRIIKAGETVALDASFEAAILRAGNGKEAIPIETPPDPATKVAQADPPEEQPDFTEPEQLLGLLGRDAR